MVQNSVHHVTITPYPPLIQYIRISVNIVVEMYRITFSYHDYAISTFPVNNNNAMILDGIELR